MKVDQFARVNNIKLHYLDHPGGEPPLVFMPGLTANAHAFDGVVRAGLSPRFRVLALDLRGRGLSDKPGSGYSLAEHARDVADLLDTLGLDRVVLGGHSFGGLLTFYMAAKYPQRVAKLIIIDAAGTLHPKIGELIKPALDRLGKVLPSWEAYVETVRQAPYWLGYWDDDVENYYRFDVQINEDRTVQSQSRPEAMMETMDCALSEPWGEHIAAIQQPVILLNAPGPYGPAGTPPVLPRENAQATVAALADARYVEIPGNHVTMLFGENARHMAEVITAFVG
jgi:pimeloyl-ACP methyl ester carboxylesterase